MHSSNKFLRWVLILVCGLGVEYFSWLINYNSQIKNPPLFHPILGVDLFIGIFFYASLGLGWNIVEKFWGLRTKDVVIMTLIFGICIEQLGAILLTFNPIFYAFVGVVYLAMVLPSFLIVRPVDKQVPIWKRYIFGLALISLCSVIGTTVLTLPFKSIIPPKPATAQIR